MLGQRPELHSKLSRENEELVFKGGRFLEVFQKLGFADAGSSDEFDNRSSCGNPLERRKFVALSKTRNSPQLEAESE